MSDLDKQTSGGEKKYNSVIETEANLRLSTISKLAVQQEQLELANLKKTTPMVRSPDVRATRTSEEMRVSPENKKQNTETVATVGEVSQVVVKAGLFTGVVSFLKEKIFDLLSVMRDEKKGVFEKFLDVWSLWTAKEKDKKGVKSTDSAVNSMHSESLESVKIPEKIKKAKESLVAKYNIEKSSEEYLEIADIKSKKLWIFNEGKISSIPMNTSKKGIGFVKESNKTPTGNFTLTVKKNIQNPRKSAGMNGQTKILGATIAWHGDDKENKNSFSRNLLTHGWPVVDGNLSGSTGCIHVSGENAIKIANNISSMKKKGKGAYLRIVA
ncbi:TPA: L,D-transpeptidase [Candidatus Gracilibacteria bacterium]|nr:L,D-transpeptidase [Candidatus Gracilibacteria bacterium]